MHTSAVKYIITEIGNHYGGTSMATENFISCINSIALLPVTETCNANNLSYKISYYFEKQIIKKQNYH